MILCFLLLAVPVQAQSGSKLIIVSPEGPIFGIKEALHQAKPGDTIEVYRGIYKGPIVVNVSVTLSGVDFPVIDGAGKGTVVKLTAPGSVLRGFTIRNSGDSLDQENSGVAAEANNLLIENNRLENTLFGIYLKEADNTILRGNYIQSKTLDLPRRGDPIRVWYSSHVLIEDNIVENGRDVVLWYSEHITVRGNEVRGGRYGLHFMYCDDAEITSNLLIGNSVGAFLMYSRRLVMEDNTIASNRGPSGYGVGMKDLDDAIISGNLFYDNRVGAHIDNSPREIDSIGWFEGNMFGYNDIGISLMPSVRHNNFTNNSFIDNQEQVLIEGGGDLKDNLWTVNERGNYWSDYVGYDQDQDGAGDLPYRAERLFENLADRFPTLRLFAISPAAQAIDFAAKAVPLVRPQPKLTDSLPLMAPEELRAIHGLPHPSSSRLTLASLGLLGIGLLSLVILRIPTYKNNNKIAPALSGEPTMISTTNLSKRFGHLVAVDQLSIQILRGESVALWGPNGAGKTTILRCLLGLFPYEGEVQVAGLNVRTHGREIRRYIGFVPQELTFHHDLLVEETLAFYARLKKVSPDSIGPLLLRTKMGEHIHKRVGELSGGMKQRLALAIALLGDPALLILDEPTSNLDAGGRGELLAQLAVLRSEGKTLLFSSHRLDEVLDLADRVLSLKSGTLLADCSPEQFFELADFQTRISLHVGKDHVRTAVHTLAESGFAASPNGKRIWVTVPYNLKGEPIRVLVEAGIPVRDFDFEYSEEARLANG
jgi:nitrous oxidase accessory protein